MSRAQQMLLGITLSSLALWLAARGVNWSEFQKVFSQLSWGWVAAALGIKLSTLLIKDTRWRIELFAVAKIKYIKTFSALCLGYFFNTVLPFKLGEVIRTSYLRRYNPKLKFGQILATIFAERVIDICVLGLLVALASLYMPIPPWLLVGALAMGIIAVALIALSYFETSHKIIVQKLQPVPGFRFVERVVSSLSQGTAVFRNPIPFALVFLITIAAWLVESFITYAAFQSLSLNVSYWACVAGTLAISVGLLVPSAPGHIGTHQALSVFIYGLLGVTETPSFSASIVMQVLNLGTLAFIGAFIMISDAHARRAFVEVKQQTKAKRAG